MTISLEKAAIALFEAHRDVLDSLNTTEWDDLPLYTQLRYRSVAGMMLATLQIPYHALEKHNADNP